jgi:hypothetical protein
VTVIKGDVGDAAAVARAMVVTAAQMSFYDRTKAALLVYLPDAPATHSLASLVAGGAAAVSSNPFDVVKTRLQNMAPRADGSMPYTGFVNCFLVTARTEGGVIMALEHVSEPLWGVQFHPESVLTEGGYTMLGNWLETTGMVGVSALARTLSPLVALDQPAQ